MEHHELTKKVLKEGSGEKPSFENGSKVLFHFKTYVASSKQEPVDDSEKMGEPFELLLGRKFKLAAWEAMVKTMYLDEVAEFLCPSQLGINYPLVSQGFRDHVHSKKYGSPPSRESSHCCKMSSMGKSLGYHDLDELVLTTPPLLFHIHLVSVYPPGHFDLDTWAMTEGDRLQKLPQWRERGNSLYSEQKYSEADEQYALALDSLERLCLLEKRGDPKWTTYTKMKVPFLLNSALCKVALGDWYSAVRYCSAVLEVEPNNEKALFTRGKAQARCWNTVEAVSDLQMAAQLKPGLQGVVKTELASMRQRSVHADTINYKRMLE